MPRMSATVPVRNALDHALAAARRPVTPALLGEPDSVNELGPPLQAAQTAGRPTTTIQRLAPTTCPWLHAGDGPTAQLSAVPPESSGSEPCQTQFLRLAPMSEETPLSDGWPSVAGAVLIEGRVHRSTGPWTAAGHALLRHLEAVQFDGAPRVVGFDEQGREVLTWVEGEAPGVPWPTWMQTDEVLASLGRLLRRYHDAVVSFSPPPGAEWRSWLGSPGGPIIRHGDLWPSNVVFRSGRPVAFIDWEFAQPGTVLDEVASAAKHWAPLCSDARAEEQGWTLPVDRITRLRVLCEAYSLDTAGRALVIPTVIRNAQFGYQSHKTWGEAGVPGFAEMWQAGSGTTILGDRAWLEGEAGKLGGFAEGD